MLVFFDAFVYVLRAAGVLAQGGRQALQQWRQLIATIGSL